MSRATARPLSRPFPLSRVTAVGVDADVTATPEERIGLASDLGLVSVDRLEARLRLAGDPDRVRVTGRLVAAVMQTCVVTLDPFPAEIDEEVALDFARADPRRAASDEVSELELSAESDEVEELSGDRIDLGAIAAEFLALALEPYPRKPGAVFEPVREEEGGSPFDRLHALKRAGEA